MSLYTWRLPSPAAAVASVTSAELAGAVARTRLGGLLDQYIDPVSLDYVDTDDGEWLETADSRSLVMIQIEMRLGEDFFASEDGTRIKAQLENSEGAPVLDDFVIAETLRAMGLLVDDGIIADISAKSGFENGRFTIYLSWRDLASGSPVDLNYQPFVQSQAA